MRCAGVPRVLCGVLIIILFDRGKYVFLFVFPDRRMSIVRLTPIIPVCQLVGHRQAVPQSVSPSAQFESLISFCWESTFGDVCVRVCVYVNVGVDWNWMDANHFFFVLIFEFEKWKIMNGIHKRVHFSMGFLRIIVRSFPDYSSFHSRFSCSHTFPLILFSLCGRCRRFSRTIFVNAYSDRTVSDYVFWVPLCFFAFCEAHRITNKNANKQINALSWVVVARTAFILFCCSVQMWKLLFGKEKNENKQIISDRVWCAVSEVYGFHCGRVEVNSYLHIRCHSELLTLRWISMQTNVEGKKECLGFCQRQIIKIWCPAARFIHLIFNFSPF